MPSVEMAILSAGHPTVAGGKAGVYLNAGFHGASFAKRKTAVSLREGLLQIGFSFSAVGIQPPIFLLTKV